MVVAPMKPGAGVKLSVPSVLIVTVPFGLLAVVTVSGSPSTSVSLARTLMPSSTVSFVADAVLFAATGASFAAVTVTATVPLAVLPLPSLRV